MTQTFWRRSVLAFLLVGALGACQSSSEKDRSGGKAADTAGAKTERAKEKDKTRESSESSATTARSRSAGTTAAKPARDRAATPAASSPSPGSDISRKQGTEAPEYTSYGQSAAGAGITEVPERNRGIGGGGDAGMRDGGTRAPRR